MSELSNHFSDTDSVITDVVQNIKPMLEMLHTIRDTCVTAPCVKLHTEHIQSSLEHYKRATAMGNAAEAQMVVLQTLTLTHNKNLMPKTDVEITLGNIAHELHRLQTELYRINRHIGKYRNELVYMQSAILVPQENTAGEPVVENPENLRLDQQFENLSKKAVEIATRNLSGELHRFVEVVASDPVAAETRKLYSIQHPLVCLYATRYDRVWTTGDSHSGLFAFTHATIMAEMHTAAECRDTDADPATTALLPSFTCIHVLRAIGFAEEDIGKMATWLDTAFYRSVRSDNHVWLLAQRYASRVGVYRGLVHRQCMQSWVDTNCQQLEQIHFYDADESLLGNPEELRKLRERVAPYVADDTVPGMYTTLPACINNWMARQNRPVAYPRDLLVIEKRFMQSTQMRPSFHLWAWPLVLRSCYVAFVKERVWQLAVMPRTASFFRAQGEDGADMYRITQDWLQRRPGGWDSTVAAPHRLASLDSHMISWSQMEGTTPDPAYDEVDMVRVQADVARRLGEPLPQDWTAFSASLAEINRIVWHAYQQQMEAEAKVTIDRQESALEGLRQIVKHSRDSETSELWADMTLNFLFNDAAPSTVERILGLSSNKRSQLYSC